MQRLMHTIYYMVNAITSDKNQLEQVADDSLALASLKLSMGTVFKLLTHCFNSKWLTTTLFGRN